MTNPLDNKLSTHRSDYEIHTPEHRVFVKRPQSTAELVRTHNKFDRLYVLLIPFEKNRL